MRIDRRVFVILAVAAILTLAIIACGGGQQEEPSPPPDEEVVPIEEPETTTGDVLDWTLEPNSGDVELETGFLPDPHSVQVLSGGSLFAGDSVPGCTGYATASPDLNFYWTGDGGNLRIFFVPDEEGDDATLIINDPVADWHCNDDAYGLNPGIDFEGAASGWYAIWVGSFFSNEMISGTLYFTEMDITPDDVAGTGATEQTEGEIRQWATSGTASTAYGTDSWSAMQATGAPDTDECGDYSTAWATETSTEVAWLRLEYATPVIPTEINIYESYNPDAVYMVDVEGADGTTYTVYEGDPTSESECPGVLTITIDADVPVSAVTVHIDQSDHTGWNEIDAVELVGISE